MYEDLYELLVPGFLSTSIDLEGHRVVLRSLSNHDLHFLHKYVREDDPAWRVHLVAHSVWMVDGIPLLEESFSHRVLFDALMRSSRGLIRGAVGTLYGFFARMREANHYLEAYLYEEDSRRLWRGLGNGAYPLHTKASIPGLDRIGLNPLQSAWVAWNGMEDTRDAQEHQWANTKVLVSLQSHKAYEKLTARDKTREENEQGRRESVQDRAYQRFLYGESDEETRRAGNAVQKARTNADLEDEMRRWIKGDLDWHDEIVESYKNRIRDEQAENERLKLETLAELRARRVSEESTLGVQKPVLRPITPAQMAEMMAGKSGSGAKFIVEADAVSRTFNRFIRPTVEPGHLSVDERGKIVEQAPVFPGKAPPVSLTDQIAERRVVLDGES